MMMMTAVRSMILPLTDGNGSTPRRAEAEETATGLDSWHGRESGLGRNQGGKTEKRSAGDPWFRPRACGYVTKTSR